MKLSADLFVAGRDAYCEQVPMVQVVERCNDIHTRAEAHEDDKPQGVPRDYDASGDAVASYVLGFLDGVLRDLRNIAEVSREIRTHQQDRM